ncbi:DUF6714 family protein [Aestuariibius insulae]|uniref:DUF6714 family protein n=1 Tax=Aestuariibius insulae TaxID=2058287 RepID=UPI00345E2B02
MEPSKSKSKLLRDIRNAFGQDKPPSRPKSWEDLTHDISSANYSEAIEETYRFWWKSWSELEMADFDKCTYLFSFLPKEHVPYFLGALMELSLKEEPYFDNLLEFFTLFDPSIAKGSEKEQFLAFNKRQIDPLEEKHLRIIFAFLQFLAASGLEDERSDYMQKFLLEQLD